MNRPEMLSRVLDRQELWDMVIVGGGVLVIHQRQVDADPVAEAKQLQLPVEPPARVLLAEEDHEQRPGE